MPRDDAFKVEGLILEALPNGTYRAELANGHRLLAFVAGRKRLTVRFSPGDRVKLQLSPFDLSWGNLRRRDGTSTKPLVPLGLLNPMMPVSSWPGF